MSDQISKDDSSDKKSETLEPTSVLRSPLGNVEVDWQVGRSVLECNRYMLENGVGADVSIDIGPEDGPTQRLMTHRYILIARSPVFEAMLCRDVGVASAEEKAGFLRVVDSDVEAFREMLRFMYYEKAAISASNVTSLLYLSKKYLLTDLTQRCYDYLESNIAVETVCSVVNAGVFYDEPDLIERCLRFIGPRMREVIASDNWVTLSREALERVVRYDCLYVDSEIDVVRACLRWASDRCTQENNHCLSNNCSHDNSSHDNGSHDNKSRDTAPARTTSGTVSLTSGVDSVEEEESGKVLAADIRRELGDTIYRIRIPNLSAAEFALHLGQDPLLSAQEKSALYYHMVMREAHLSREAIASGAAGGSREVERVGGNRGANGSTGGAQGAEETRSQSPSTASGSSSKHKKAARLPVSTRAVEVAPSVAGFDVGARVQVCDRFASLGTAQQWWSCNGPADAVCVQVDRDVEVIGVGVYGGKERASLVVSISIYKGINDSGTTSLLSSINELKLESDGSSTPIPIYLPSYVRLRAQVNYTLVVTITGPLTHYGTTGREQVTASDGSVTFRFCASSRSTNGSNTKSGQIPQIIYKLS